MPFDVGGGLCSVDGALIFDGASRVTNNTADNGAGGIFHFGAGTV